MTLRVWECHRKVLTRVDQSPKTKSLLWKRKRSQKARHIQNLKGLSMKLTSVSWLSQLTALILSIRELILNINQFRRKLKLSLKEYFLWLMEMRFIKSFLRNNFLEKMLLIHYILRNFHLNNVDMESDTSQLTLSSSIFWLSSNLSQHLNIQFQSRI